MTVTNASLFPSADSCAGIFDLEFGADLVRMPLSEGAQVTQMTFGPTGAVTADNGLSVNASYTSLAMPAKPTFLAAKWCFTSGADATGSLAIAFNENGQLDIDDITGANGRTHGSMHITCSNTTLSVGYFNANSLTNVAAFTLDRKLETDDATEHDIAIWLDSAGVTVRGPDGITQPKVLSANLSINAGRFVSVESFTNALAGYRCRIKDVTSVSPPS